MHLGDNGREGEKDEERGGGKLRKRGENGSAWPPKLSTMAEQWEKKRGDRTQTEGFPHKNKSNLHLYASESNTLSTPGKLNSLKFSSAECFSLHLSFFSLKELLLGDRKHTESVKIEELTQPFPLPLFLLLLPLSSSLNHSSSW